MKPSNIKIRSTVYPDKQFKNFTEWINYIHAESERRFRQQLTNFLTNKINQQ